MAPISPSLATRFGRVAAVGLVGLLTLAPPAIATCSDGPGLADLSDLTVGTAVSPAGMEDADYLCLVAAHFSLVVPEWGMYMTNLQPRRGEWDFSRADEIVNFAESSGQMVRGHTLIWGLPLSDANPFGGWTPTPAWLHDGDLSRDEAIRVMTDHIESVMTRYRGRVGEWVVVNESLGEKSAGGMKLNPNIWLELIGPEYISIAFHHARKVDPETKLMINEYGVDYLGQSKSGRVEAYYGLVSRLLADGVPIDAVGFQFHLEVGRDRPTVEAITDNMARYRKLGVSVHITELDARIRKPVTIGALGEQALLLHAVFRAAVGSLMLEDVVMWGFTDRYSWITAGETFPDHAAGVMFDRDLRPRPSYVLVRRALGDGFE